MKTKIVYVLVSSPEDLYLEMAYVSMCSVKHHNPDATIVLVVDSATNASFTSTRASFSNKADEIIVVELDSNIKAQKRSRILKTSVCQHVKGDYLFIDTDTVVVRKLDDIDGIQSNIAACWDTHSCFSKNPFRDMCLGQTKVIGCDCTNEKEYFNSGVIYVKDNPLTHDFYSTWHKYYLEGYEKGISMDQPSFAKTNINMGHIVKRLPDVWNCELKHGIRYLKDCYVVHYLTTNKAVADDIQLFTMNDERVLLKIKTTGELNSEITSLFDDPFRGIASLTHCFAGKDVYFFKTNTFNKLHRSYNNNGYLYKIINMAFCISSLPHRVISKIKKVTKNVIGITRRGRLSENSQSIAP